MKLMLARFVILLWGLLLAACSGNGVTDVPHDDHAGEDHESHTEDADLHVHDEDELAEYLAEIHGLVDAGLVEGETLQVIATTSIVGDIVSTVGGNAIELHVLIPRGKDPHGYQATPQDLTRVADADLIIINGFGLEEGFIDDLVQVADEVPIISISEGIEPLDFVAETEDHEHEGEDHEHGGVDPHIWFDPIKVLVWVENVADAFSGMDPNNEDVYKSNADAFETEIEALHAWIQEQVAEIPMDKRLLVTDHHSFAYFAHRYGFSTLGAVIPAYSTSASPSAKDLAELNDLIAEYQVRAIFVGRTTNPQLAESIAQDTGIQIVPLFTGSLGVENEPGDTYISMMRENVTDIVTTLRP
jgi:ABC-type Zn uptake system ZnuABC Zn-binding protein ZnuA